MKKLKKDELSKSVKKFLRKKKLKASEYEHEFVDKTCALLTTAFNKSYDATSSALGSIEEQIGKVHDAIFREEQEAAKASSKGKASSKKAGKKGASKKSKKPTTKKAASKPVKKKTATKKAPAKKSTAKAVKKAAPKKKAAKRVAKKTTRKAPAKKTSAE